MDGRDKMMTMLACFSSGWFNLGTLTAQVITTVFHFPPKKYTQKKECVMQLNKLG